MKKDRKNQKYDLEQRTKEFGFKIIDFVKDIPVGPITRTLISQIIRSGTSIGANYLEANGADTKKGFIYRINICKRESKETKYWFDMIFKTAPYSKIKYQNLYNETNELILIFSKISSTCKKQKNKIIKNLLNKN